MWTTSRPEKLLMEPFQHTCVILIYKDFPSASTTKKIGIYIQKIRTGTTLTTSSGKIFWNIRGPYTSSSEKMRITRTNFVKSVTTKKYKSKNRKKRNNPMPQIPSSLLLPTVLDLGGGAGGGK